MNRQDAEKWVSISAAVRAAFLTGNYAWTRSFDQAYYSLNKVNVDENPDLARKYRVMSIPTVLVFKNGELTATSVGVDSKENILKLLEK